MQSFKFSDSENEKNEIDVISDSQIKKVFKTTTLNRTKSQILNRKIAHTKPEENKIIKRNRTHDPEF